MQEHLSQDMVSQAEVKQPAINGGPKPRQRCAWLPSFDAHIIADWSECFELPGVFKALPIVILEVPGSN